MKDKINQLPTYFQEYLDSRFQQVDGQFQQTNNKIDEINARLAKMDFTTNPEHLELKNKVSILEKRADEQDKWRNVIVGAWFALAGIFGIVGFALRQFISDVFSHIYKP